jgi:CRISPR system Cascade subunit CasB
MDRHLAPRLAPDMSADEVRALYTVASLIAAQPRNPRRTAPAPPDQGPADQGPTDQRNPWRHGSNLGASLAHAANNKILKAASAEDDLLAMDRLSVDALNLRLPALTRHLLGQGTPIHWATLLKDLARWNRDRAEIAARWQTTYYRARTPAGTEPATPQFRPETFVSQVAELCSASSEVRADLRSGLGLPPQRCQRMHRHLVPLMPAAMHPDALTACYMVAALIASRRNARDEDDTATQASGSDLGALLAKSVIKGAIRADAAEQELHLMTRQSRNVMRRRLPALVNRLRGLGHQADWALLLNDLTWWDRNRAQVAARWMDSYFLVRSASDRNNPEQQKENH